MHPNLAAALSARTLGRLHTALDLRERAGPQGLPYTALVHPATGAPVGEARIYDSPSLQRLVTIRLTVDALGLDSHMLFAFTPPGSAVPHFTLDAVCPPGGAYAFHLDLVPRVDLAADLRHLRAVYGPLTAAFERGVGIEGLSAAKLSPVQRALMSPWMLAFHATPDAFAQIDGVVDAYLDQFLALLAAEEPATDLDPAALAARDAACRSALFDPSVDPVWSTVDHLVGADASAGLRDLLRT